MIKNMAKFKNIKTGETIIMPDKRAAMEYFLKKDPEITQFHLKNVVMINGDIKIIEKKDVIKPIIEKEDGETK